MIYTPNFSPELTGIGKYTGEMAQWMGAAGHEIRVVCAPPHYPQWEVRKPYRWWWYARANMATVQVIRAPIWVPRKPSGLKRLLHLMSFMVSSLPLLLSQIRWRPQVIWLVEPSLVIAPSALLLAKLVGAKTWLHIQDYEVDAAFDLGLLKGGRLRQLALGFERWVMEQCGVVSTISSRMMDRARAKGVSPSKLVSFPNWVDIQSIQPLSGVSSYRQELGISPAATVALYSGNMGNKQGLEILADAARLLSHDASIQFVFCGNGSGRQTLMDQCQNLRNVRFLDLQPIERLSDLLGLADVHLLPQRADAADLVMPSKLTGMLASGRPVIATAMPDTELARVVVGLGVVVAPEQPEDFARALSELAADPARRVQMGQAARRYAEQELDRDAILGRFDQQLRNLGQTARKSDTP